MKRYSDNAAPAGRKAATRAVQAWLLLVGHIMEHARRRGRGEYPTITYAEMLARVRYKMIPSSYGRSVLGYLWHWCDANDLPFITSVVVDQGTGQPGEGIGLKDPEAELRWVYEIDWHDIMPPTVDELLEARPEY